MGTHPWWPSLVVAIILLALANLPFYLVDDKVDLVRLPTRASALADSLEVLLADGHRLFAQHNYEKACEAFGRALKRANALRASAAYARTMYFLGAAQSRAHNPQAVETLGEARRLFETHGFKDEPLVSEIANFVLAGAGN
jgi:tetratricopeptide (TPR) repeat protein